MKNRLNSKKAIIATLIVGVITMLSVTGLTLAYYSDTTPVKENTFTVGNVTTDIEETIDPSKNQKEPYVVNSGKNDCLIRMRVTVSPDSSTSNLELSGGNKDLWKKRADEANDKNAFFYYHDVVKPNEKTDPIFSNYRIIDKEEFVPFDITLYQEAVQAEAVDQEGNVISALDENGKFNEEEAKKIWDIYDASQNTK